MKSTGPYAFDPKIYQEILLPLVSDLPQVTQTNLTFTALSKRYPKPNGTLFTKTEVLKAYQFFAGSHGLPPYNNSVALWLRKKPTRTISGVAPITILTKPFPCPGNCIFCPSDIRMPKSYLSSEPGAQRAANNYFDPYLQTYNRLLALQEMGHPVKKAEVIVLGGTWSVYPLGYKIWFVKRLFDALNDFGLHRDQRPRIQPSLIPAASSQLLKGKTYNQSIGEIYSQQEKDKRRLGLETSTWAQLKIAHKLNETAPVRCVGLVLESRPDAISPQEVKTLRRLGATKTQIGLQSLNDQVLNLNQRGHDVAASRRAMRLLRQAGFKLHIHWMPNLYGSSVVKDKADFRRLFTDPDFKPDELKIYPCSLIANTPLVKLHRLKVWQPYSKSKLLNILSYCLTQTPLYCRVTRVVRDIPSQDILVGNKLSNFRQLADQSIQSSGGVLKDIRAREIRRSNFDSTSLKLNVLTYETSISTEKFLQFVTSENKLAAFLRLSLPKNPVNQLFSELDRESIIREVHVYGQTIEVGEHQKDSTQHQGLGKLLINHAKILTQVAGFKKMAVISAVGTREYYRHLGFTDGLLYQHLHV